MSNAAPISIDSERFRWSVHEIDHDYAGDWDWDLSPTEAKDILDLLARMSALNWREVKALSTHSRGGSRPLHHSQSVTSICADAQRRLGDVEIVVDEVFRLRHGNLPRLWGYLSGAVFNIVPVRIENYLQCVIFGALTAGATAPRR